MIDIERHLIQVSFYFLSKGEPCEYMNDLISMVIEDKVLSDLVEPKSSWPEIYFKKQSYSRYACEEIIRLIRFNKSKNPFDIIDDFVEEAKNCYDECDNLSVRIIFESFLETAYTILSIF